ncbi:MAG: hypothetical protein R3B70_09615 [Polyangiaceae bacterium]
MNMHRVSDLVRRVGPGAAALDVAYRAANRVTEMQLLKAMSLTMDTVDRRFLEQAGKLSWGFVGEEALLRALGEGAGDDMDAAFVKAALARGDRCFGAADGELLASYGWYSTRPTPVTDDLLLRFDGAYAYMYKGYTLPEYRGKRLHGIGMARAMAAHVAEGKRGLVSYVAATNFASLRSCHRLGYRDLGWILAVRVGGRIVTRASRSCQAFGFLVEPVAD